MPVVSKVLWGGLKPSSSASVPKTRAPPRLGVADEIPSGGGAVPVEEGLELQPELHAATRPPPVPTNARPAPVVAPRARNERRSIRSDMVSLRMVAGLHGGHGASPSALRTT